MDLKKKRERLITWVLAMGVFLPLLFLMISPAKSIKSNSWLLCVFYCFCFISIKITELTAIFVKSQSMFLPILCITHILTCFFIGWIIARLVYPNSKSLPESTNTPKAN